MTDHPLGNYYMISAQPNGRIELWEYAPGMATDDLGYTFAQFFGISQDGHPLWYQSRKTPPDHYTPIDRVTGDALVEGAAQKYRDAKQAEAAKPQPGPGIPKRKPTKFEAKVLAVVNPSDLHEWKRPLEFRLPNWVNRLDFVFHRMADAGLIEVRRPAPYAWEEYRIGGPETPDTSAESQANQTQDATPSPAPREGTREADGTRLGFS